MWESALGSTSDVITFLDFALAPATTVDTAVAFWDGTGNQLASSDGISILEGPGGDRRIDIELVSPEQYPYALLYFTGSKEHNILMRSKAAEKGWRLNEKEMYVIESGDRITVKDEKEIFSLLGVPYKEAWER